MIVAIVIVVVAVIVGGGGGAAAAVGIVLVAKKPNDQLFCQFLPEMGRAKKVTKGMRPLMSVMSSTVSPRSSICREK